MGSAAALSASATSSQSLLLWALQTPGATQTGVDWPGLGELTWGTLWRVSDGMEATQALRLPEKQLI